MNHEFQQYRFARIEAENITRVRLEAQFKNGIGGLEEIEKAIEQFITTEPACTPWRTSEVERAASRDGTRMAALEFYWEHRHRRQSVNTGSGYLAAAKTVPPFIQAAAPEVALPAIPPAPSPTEQLTLNVKPGEIGPTDVGRRGRKRKRSGKDTAESRPLMQMD